MGENPNHIKELERYSLLLEMLNFLYREAEIPEVTKLNPTEYNEVRAKLRRDYHILSETCP